MSSTTTSVFLKSSRLKFSRLLSRPLSSSACEARDDEFASLVIQSKDLLRRSQQTSAKNSTGLHVLDILGDRVDRSLYHLLLKKCTDSKRISEGRIVHAHILISVYRDDLIMHNTILNMYAKCSSLDEARKVFDQMLERDSVSWTTLISGYSQHEQPQDALLLFSRMLKLGFRPNEFTLSSTVKAAAAEAGYSCGRQLHGFCLKSSFDSNVYVGSSLLDMYTRYGLMDDARLIFDTLESRNEVSWNALIAGHARKSGTEKALELFRGMLREGFKPSHFSYSSLFGACSGTGFLEQGKWVHAYMIKSGEKLIAFAGNTLLDMYAKSGSIHDARKIFDRLAKRDVVSWNSLLTAYAQHGFGKEALRLFEDMKRVGIPPNGITFLAVLMACSHSGLLDEGWYYFESMKKHGLRPEVWHYVTIVDLLGRAGFLDRAMEFIREMPLEPAAAIWKSLLNACRMHKNSELGAYAAERVFELDPDDPGPHVILYNIYASAGRWNDAARVRKKMRESGVKKEPACSWVEIENSIHMFIANDTAHPQREEIRRKWEEVYAKIKELGYEPDTSQVVVHVDQQEREANLQCHSEKIALAFALLNTAPGSTIVIKKNIRVCGDCHSAIKLASMAVGREIIVRDTNRYHHFKDGTCSCGDYW
ncbi:PREDICTED: pentatricopeptide repeat-containing protein At3g24000, mitochondrial [Tarenaya hassleriana]|uniref:pentatricopeptide repeat-containing protein At3g24000, mitochondrial n=1 Tax=Tarenaya hassleriana TaxID=28532 RepID=UPI00053C8F23|nr:PREDICTED: pentatricopeptide repeat-containing protein At3g24000, mitochondrial [Tarenaya hassleriana]